tara:strand:+ start:502 stop:1113 length:612 start_codon:yes stop_codon:yes gene_type:complete
MKQSITGNAMFIKRTILPLTKQVGIKKVNVKNLPALDPDDKTRIELTFDLDKEQNDKLLALMKKKAGGKGTMKRKKLNLTVFKEKIKEMIKDELQNLTESKKAEGKEKDFGFRSDVKKFKQEYDSHQGKFKEKAMGLRERQQMMKAVGVVNEKIMGMIGELSKLPVEDALENVKKGHVNKYIRAIETLKGICEHNSGWLEENK